MKIFVAALVIIVLVVGGWVFLNRSNNTNSNQSALPAEVQQNPQQETTPALPSLADRRAAREKAAMENEGGFNEPPQIKIPEFSNSQEADGKEKGGGGGFKEAWDKITFPSRVIGWVIDNLCFLIVLIIVGIALLIIFGGTVAGKIIGNLIKLPLKIAWEVVVTLFLRRSIFDAFGDTKKDAGTNNPDPKSNQDRIRRGRK